MRTPLKKEQPMIKTTLQFEEAIWREAKIRAMDERISLTELVELAVKAYLKQPKRERK
jgi:hypothetical protein